MSEPRDSMSDFEIETIVGNLLRIGVLIAAAVVTVGAIIYLARHGMEVRDYHVFRGEPSSLRSVSGIVAAAVSLHGAAIIQLGLLLLIATPIARVVFSLFAFALERDWMYVIVTTIVLAVLAYSLTGGFGYARDTPDQRRGGSSMNVRP